MVHVSSFFIGSAVSGASFLAVHRQLSFRSQQTDWPLVESWFRNRLQNAATQTSSVREEKVGVSNRWNEALDTIRTKLGK
ncbi:unnamed protein product [Cylindrotheca closterium]|uniref:Uncharacterized protein n=1 Tax=Cylindrotheca closterium TaxID=2856 RepID=A0AAD2GB81_9STRA|nr:unnamed protein product [Cylindrotheca closterium]